MFEDRERPRGEPPRSYRAAICPSGDRPPSTRNGVSGETSVIRCRLCLFSIEPLPLFPSGNSGGKYQCHERACCERSPWPRTLVRGEPGRGLAGKGGEGVAQGVEPAVVVGLERDGIRADQDVRLDLRDVMAGESARASGPGRSRSGRWQLGRFVVIGFDRALSSGRFGSPSGAGSGASRSRSGQLRRTCSTGSLSADSSICWARTCRSAALGRLPVGSIQRRMAQRPPRGHPARGGKAPSCGRRRGPRPQPRTEIEGGGGPGPEPLRGQADRFLELLAQRSFEPPGHILQSVRFFEPGRDCCIGLQRSKDGLDDRLRRAVEPDRQLKMLQSGREIVGLGQLARHDRGDLEELLSRFGPGVQERSLELGRGRGRALGRQDEPAQQDGGAQMVGLRTEARSRHTSWPRPAFAARSGEPISAITATGCRGTLASPSS